MSVDRLAVLVHELRSPVAAIAAIAAAFPDAPAAQRARLLELAAAPLRFGLPDVLTPDGREVVRQILTREIRVHGLLRHLGTVRRVSLLLSAR